MKPADWGMLMFVWLFMPWPVAVFICLSFHGCSIHSYPTKLVCHSCSCKNRLWNYFSVFKRKMLLVPNYLIGCCFGKCSLTWKGFFLPGGVLSVFSDLMFPFLMLLKTWDKKYTSFFFFLEKLQLMISSNNIFTYFSQIVIHQAKLKTRTQLYKRIKTPPPKKLIDKTKIKKLN